MENDAIYGDSFQAGDEMVRHIGNNVSLLFKGIDLQKGSSAVEITGRAHGDRNTVHLRFPGREAIAVEFEHTEELVTRRFEIERTEGVTDLQVMFLPGSDLT